MCRAYGVQVWGGGGGGTPYSEVHHSTLDPPPQLQKPKPDAGEEAEKPFYGEAAGRRFRMGVRDFGFSRFDQGCKECSSLV